MKIDLTKGKLMISHTVWPNGVRSDYYPPGSKIEIPLLGDPPLWPEQAKLIYNPQIKTMTPREYYEKHKQ